MRMNVTATVLGLAMIAGCSTPGYKAAAKTNNSLSDVKTELLTDKSGLRTAVNDLNDLVYRPQSDLRPQYEKFRADVATLKKSAAASQASANNMRDNRESYLSQWRADTSAISDADLRMRAMDRIRETEDNFSALSDKINSANNALAPVVNDLGALSEYLGNDLTASNIQLISDRATSAKNRSITVNQKIDAAVTELDKVSDTIAPMPANSPATMESSPTTMDSKM